MSGNDAAEVVVVGAGYAGLTAALALHDAGRSVVVLEARALVGGRVHTEHHDGVPLDLGGMWVGATHQRFRSLLSRFDIATFPTPEFGVSGWWDPRTRSLRPSRIIPAPWQAIPSAAAAVAQIELLARRTATTAAPAGSPGIDRWDAVTVADWLRRRVPGPAARAMLESALVVSFSVELSQVSMRSLFISVTESGGLLRLLGTDGGAQQDLVVGGADRLARQVAERLGDRVRRSTPVRAIRHEPDGVVVMSAHGSWTAQYAIVALPPAHVAALDWQPALNGSRRQLLDRLHMGSVTKLLAVYDRPFWRDAGWSGEVLDAHGPVTTAFEATQPGGPAVLASLTCGERSLELSILSAEERRQRILGAFAEWFGPEAAEPRTVVDRSWENEEWSGGGYSAVPAPGVVSSPAMPLIAEPVGRVHFAGTETSPTSNGYIDGAIASGERAADEINTRMVSVA